MKHSQIDYILVIFFCGGCNRFQDMYEEGERELLMNEISELRNQCIFSLDGNSKHPNLHETKVRYHACSLFKHHPFSIDLAILFCFHVGFQS